jgi:regulator of ribosome biosynthesis
LLLELSRGNTQLLLNQIFALPTTYNALGVLATLPTKSTSQLPRAKPIPKENQMTRWEKFAKQKGIQKKKKSRMVWDEDKKEWRPRWGYKGVTEGKEKDWLIEIPRQKDPMVDYFTQAKEEKKERINKNKKRQQRNLEEATMAAAGITDVREAKKARKELIARELSLVQKSTASMGKFDKQLKGEPKPKKGKKVIKDVDTAQERSKQLQVVNKLIT